MRGSVLSILDVPPGVQLVASERTFGELVHSWLRSLDGRISLPVVYSSRTRIPEPVRDTGIEWRWLYFARGRDSGLLKIGVTCDPVTRMVALPKACYLGKETVFDLVGAIPFCGTTHERAVCTVLRPFIAFGEEWFRDCLETRAFAWAVAQHRNDQDYRNWHWHTAHKLGEAMDMLSWLCGGERPRWARDRRLRAELKTCGACGARGHSRRKCPLRNTEAA